VQKEDELDLRAAIKVAAQKYPDLAQGYGVTLPA